MRFLALLPLLLVAPIPALAQTTPSKLPPANPLPPPETDEGAVLAPVNAFFAGLAARDVQAILATTRPGATATAVAEKPDGTTTIRQMTIDEFTARLAGGTERLQEWLVSPAIEIDGDLAMVWSHYGFRIDGKFSHCGTDHFSLIRENGAWKIQSLAWTQRTTNCAAG